MKRKNGIAMQGTHTMAEKQSHCQSLKMPVWWGSCFIQYANSMFIWKKIMFNIPNLALNKPIKLQIVFIVLDFLILISDQ
jgi:hypothetical protein